MSNIKIGFNTAEEFENYYNEINNYINITSDELLEVIKQNLNKRWVCLVKLRVKGNLDLCGLTFNRFSIVDTIFENNVYTADAIFKKSCDFLKITCYGSFYLHDLQSVDNSKFKKFKTDFFIDEIICVLTICIIIVNLIDTFKSLH